MKRIFTLTLSVFALQFSLMAQPEGDVFPDFTVDDIDGNTHVLQDYLDDGKIVLIDVFATWCGTCINSLPALDDIYEDHGPEGDNTVVMLSFENDPSTSNEAAFVTNNNVPNPVISDGLDEIATWNTLYQPNFFIVCPDGSFSYHFAGVGSNSQTLLNYIEECAAIGTGLDDLAQNVELKFYTNPVEDRLDFVINTSQIMNYSVVDISGKTVLNGQTESNQNSINVSDLERGIYFLQLNGNKQNGITKKFIKQ